MWWCELDHEAPSLHAPDGRTTARSSSRGPALLSVAVHTKINDGWGSHIVRKQKVVRKNEEVCTKTRRHRGGGNGERDQSSAEKKEKER